MANFQRVDNIETSHEITGILLKKLKDGNQFVGPSGGRHLWTAPYIKIHNKHFLSTSITFI